MKPSVLLLLQGWGLSSSWQQNAFLSARTPNFDNLWQRYEHKVLKPVSKLKNLDRNIYYRAFYSEEYFENNSAIIDSLFAKKEILQSIALKKMFSHVLQHSSKLHLILTISQDNKFGNTDHLLEIVKIAKMNGLFRIKIHLFIDEKIPDKTAIGQINIIEKQLSDANLEISTVHPLSSTHKQSHNSALSLLLTGKGKKVLSPSQAFSISKGNMLSESFITSSDPSFKLLDFDGLLFCDHTLSAISPLLCDLIVTQTYHQRFAPKYLEVYSFLNNQWINEENWIVSKSAKLSYFSKLKGSYTKGLIISDASTIDLISSLTDLPDSVELLKIGNLAHIDKQIENFNNSLVNVVSKDYDWIIADLPFIYNMSLTGHFSSLVSAIKKIDNFLPTLESCILKAGGILNISSFYGLAESLSLVPLPSGDLPEISGNPLPLITVSPDHCHKSVGTFSLTDLAFGNADFNFMKNYIFKNSIS